MLLTRHPVLDVRSVRAAQADGTLFRQTEAFDALGDPAHFHIRVNSLLLHGLRISAVQTTGHRVRPVDADNATLLLSQAGVLETDDGRATLRVRDGEAVLPRPGRRSTTVPGPYVGLVLQVPMAVLATRAALNGEDAWRPDRDWPARAPARLARALRYVVTELDAPEAPTMACHVADGFGRLLTDLLLEGFVAQAEAATRPASPAGLRQVMRAEALLRARIGQAVSIAALAGELGVGTRSLQAGFRRHRGTTPHAFLAACRLDTARDLLVRARPGETVGSIAYGCGLTHLGRFAAAYRDRFGESPSATLARAQRGA
jgi:AraC-like DNA-binding protein